MEIHKKNAINIILGAVMEWDQKFKKWTFPNIVEKYPGKLVMGEVRAEAAAEIHESAPLMLVTGGHDFHPETGKKYSRAEELRKRIIFYGAPEDKIKTIGDASEKRSNTKGNVQDVIDYLTLNPKILKTNKRIGILCPLFQNKRAELMFDKNPYFKERKIELYWMIAEQILCEKDPSRWHEFAELYNTPQAEINRKMEIKGVDDLLNNSYQ
jgi:hypothetical protein